MDSLDWANFIENTFDQHLPNVFPIQICQFAQNIMLIFKICQNFGIIKNITLVKTTFSVLSAVLKIIEEVFSTQCRGKFTFFIVFNYFISNQFT